MKPKGRGCGRVISHHLLQLVTEAHKVRQLEKSVPRGADHLGERRGDSQGDADKQGHLFVPLDDEAVKVGFDPLPSGVPVDRRVEIPNDEVSGGEQQTKSHVLVAQRIV